MGQAIVMLRHKSSEEKLIEHFFNNIRWTQVGQVFMRN